MSKYKKKLTQQQLFSDSDVDKPLHDDMIIWISEHYEKIIYTLFKKDLMEPVGYEVYMEKINAWKEHFKIGNLLLNRPKINRISINTEMEHVIRSKYKIVGYVDFQVIALTNIVKLNLPDKSSIDSGYMNTNEINIFKIIDFQESPNKINWELVDKYRRTYERIPTHHDLARNRFYPIESVVYSFEAKPRIPSLGELLRQIKTYESYEKSIFIIVSPDDKYKKYIEEQGYYFLKYNPDIF